MSKKKKKECGSERQGRMLTHRLAAENFCLWMLISQEGLMDEAIYFLEEYAGKREWFPNERAFQEYTGAEGIHPLDPSHSGRESDPYFLPSRIF